MQLQTRDQLSKLGLRKSRTTLGEILGLHNCAVANITPQLWHDVTPQLRSSAKRKDGVINMMITYDVTPQQRDGWQNQLIAYDATKMGGAYSDGIINNTPLSHQILMNIRSFLICQTPIETNDFPNTTY